MSEVRSTTLQQISALPPLRKRQARAQACKKQGVAALATSTALAVIGSLAALPILSYSGAFLAIGSASFLLSIQCMQSACKHKQNALEKALTGETLFFALWYEIDQGIFSEQGKTLIQKLSVPENIPLIIKLFNFIKNNARDPIVQRCAPELISKLLEKPDSSLFRSFSYLLLPSLLELPPQVTKLFLSSSDTLYQAFAEQCAATINNAPIRTPLPSDSIEDYKEIDCFHFALQLKNLEHAFSRKAPQNPYGFINRSYYSFLMETKLLNALQNRVPEGRSISLLKTLDMKLKRFRELQCFRLLLSSGDLPPSQKKEIINQSEALLSDKKLPLHRKEQMIKEMTHTLFLKDPESMIEEEKTLLDTYTKGDLSYIEAIIRRTPKASLPHAFGHLKRIAKAHPSIETRREWTFFLKQVAQRASLPNLIAETDVLWREVCAFLPSSSQA